MNTDKITSTQPFAAIVKPSARTGSKTLVMKSPAWFAHQINKFQDGEEVSLIITNRRPKRSEQQNAYYWGVYLPLISKETGEQDIDRLHELFKGLFLTKAIVKVLGKPVRIKKSTTELSISEFSEYIMKIEAETGIAAPPTENYSLDLEEKENPKVGKCQNCKESECILEVVETEKGKKEWCDTCVAGRENK